MDNETPSAEAQDGAALQADEVARLLKENAALRTLIARMVSGAGGVYVVPAEVLLRTDMTEFRLEATRTAEGLEVRLRPLAAPEPAPPEPAPPEPAPAEPAPAEPAVAPEPAPAEPAPAEPAPTAFTQSEVMTMPLASFEAHFGFRPDEALEKYWFAITGKRLGRAERAAIVASMAGRMPDLRHVVME
jgi:hypothetical protein